MTLRGFLIPEQMLHQMIEMCMTVGLEPEAFDLFEASCDAETLARWFGEEWLEEETAEELREIYRNGLMVLANNWAYTGPLKTATSEMRRESADDGTIEACVLDLKPAVQADLLALLDHAAGERQLAVELTFEHRQLIDELFVQHTLYPTTKASPARRLGPRGEVSGFTFMLPIEIFAHSFHGVPELGRRAGDDSSLIELTGLLNHGCAQRLAWVGTLSTESV